MNAQNLILNLDRFGRAMPAFMLTLSDEDARWKPADGAWSILEVVRHLIDEEIEDFRVRLRLTLENPSEAWPKIDPVDWANSRRYNEAALDEVAHQFADERAVSLRWLQSLRNPDWLQAYQHPKIGLIRAGDLLTAWVAHDALHLRQIAKRMFQLAERDGEGFSSRYAGEWTI